jgi:outer membrane receptor protein involved in Fe transport
MPAIRVMRPLLAVMAAGAVAQPSLAQEPAPEAATLPPMVVTAPRLSGSPTRPSNEEAEAAARQIPGNVSIVPAEAFRDRAGVTTVRDMLLYTPGVFASRSGARIRGCRSAGQAPRATSICVACGSTRTASRSIWRMAAATSRNWTR